MANIKCNGTIETERININSVFSALRNIGGGFEITDPNNVGIEIGRRDGTPGTPYLDFHTDGNPNTDFNVRLLAEGSALFLNAPGGLIINGQHLHPIGSLYLSVSEVSPSALLGGTWEQLSEGRALWTTTTAGQGGATINAGLPNITGYTKMGCQVDACSGAIYSSNTRSDGRTGSSATAHSMYFDASRSNGIYGASSTVQPPAIKVYVWKRVG